MGVSCRFPQHFELVNNYSQIFNVHSVSYIRHVEIHTFEPAVLKPSSVEVESAAAISRKNKMINNDPAKFVRP
jgi:hypothetical protein